MKTVWVIEEGSYSDYNVVGVFSTKENAEAIATKINEPDEFGSSPGATVAEWPLDPSVEALRQGLTRFTVVMLRNGEAERVNPNKSRWNYGTVDTFDLRELSKAPIYRGKEVPDVLMASVWARDEAHAVKIVNERRAQMIASGEWK